MTMSEQITTEVPAEQVEKTAEEPKQAEQTFTQADVNRIVKERLERAEAKFAEKQSGAQATAEERIAALEKQNSELARDRLVSRIQAKHGISDEDRDLFLTGADEDALELQASRLAERAENQKKQGNVARNEGASKNIGSPESENRQFAGSLFGQPD